MTSKKESGLFVTRSFVSRPFVSRRDLMKNAALASAGLALSGPIGRAMAATSINMVCWQGYDDAFKAGLKVAFEAIVEGKLNCTVECNPLLGPAAFDTVEKLLADIQQFTQMGDQEDDTCIVAFGRSAE